MQLKRDNIMLAHEELARHIIKLELKYVLPLNLTKRCNLHHNLIVIIFYIILRIIEYTANNILHIVILQRAQSYVFDGLLL